MTQTTIETDVFGNKEDWGEDQHYYYGQQVTKMAEEWKQDEKPQKESRRIEGLGKDIKTWRRRQTTSYAKPHPMEQRPVTKLPSFPTDRETLRVPLRADRHVVVQSFRDKVYVNIREFYRHEGTKKWLPRKKGINLTMEDSNALMEAATKIDEAVQALYQSVQDRTE